MKILISLFTAFLLFSPSTWAENTSPNVAVIDMEFAVQNVKDGQSAKKEMEQAYDKLKKVFEEDEKGIRALIEDLNKKKPVLNEEAFGRKQAEIQKKVYELQQKKMEAERSLKTKEVNLSNPIIEKIEKIVSDLAKERGYNLVLERSQGAVVFASQSQDITQEVVTRYNKGK